MSTENDQPTQFSDYPVNVFEESRDHANLWDLGALSSHHKPERRKEKPARPVSHRAIKSRDHANLWDVSALLPERKPQPHDAKEFRTKHTFTTNP
jgi:hypothetical protein